LEGGVQRRIDDRAQKVYFYGVDRTKLGTYSLILNTSTPAYLADPPISLNVFFGRKLLVPQDRLGSVGKYYP
jgi:hypothetical protein